MIWFTSDLHLGHTNILRHANRPFNTIHQMNDRLIGSINDRVSWSDELWVIGDFSFRIPTAEVIRLRERINCRTVNLVRGNHDVHFAQEECPFQKEVNYYEGLHTSDSNRYRLVLFHYPIMDWNGANDGAINLHGHIHAHADYNERNRSQGLFRYDVGVDANGYAPVSLADIETFFAGVEPRRIHHTDPF